MKLQLSPGILVFWLVTAVLGYGREGGLALLFSALHEGAHFAAAKALGLHAERISFGFFGGVLTLRERVIKPWKELPLHLAGPFCNLLLASGFWMILRNQDAAGLSYAAVAGWIFPAFWLNLGLACFNLLPLLPLDGGKAMAVYLRFFLGEGLAFRISWFFSVIFAIFLFLLGVFLVQYNKADLLLCAAGIRLFQAAQKEKQQAFCRMAETLWSYAPAEEAPERY